MDAKPTFRPLIGKYGSIMPRNVLTAVPNASVLRVKIAS
jgi:hypothetical protein